MSRKECNVGRFVFSVDLEEVIMKRVLIYSSDQVLVNTLLPEFHGVFEVKVANNQILLGVFLAEFKPDVFIVDEGPDSFKNTLAICNTLDSLSQANLILLKKDEGKVREAGDLQVDAVFTKPFDVRKLRVDILKLFS